jgi:hypothetical protein
MWHRNTDADLVKASARKTPQPTPGPLSGDQASEQVIGTTQRLSNLRRDCLIRDHHRCVISHKFDIREGEKRAKRDGDNARDDDGQLLKHDKGGAEFLEVAHILPHSLTSLTAYGGDSQLVCQVLLESMVSPSLINLRATQRKLPFGF